jgi:methylation protein MtfA
MTGPVPQPVPGLAAEALAGLDREITFHDFYDQVGAPIYHDLVSGDTGEIRELQGIVRRIPGPVLELGAGSGRLTLPLLALGRDVTALERSGDMLGLLRAELLKVPQRMRERCDLVRGDMTTFAFDSTFPVIVLGTKSLLSARQGRFSPLDEAGRARLYQAVRSHLAPGGRFLLSSVEIDRSETESRDVEWEVLGAGGRRYRIFEHWPAGSLRRTFTIVPEGDGPGPVTVCTTSIAVLAAGFLERELLAAGLVVRLRIPLPRSGLRHRDFLLEVEAL